MKLKIKRKKTSPLGIFIDFLVMLLLFSGPVLNSFLYLFGITASSGQLAIIYLFVDVTDSNADVHTVAALASVTGMSASDLQSYVIAQYGRRPVERAVPATVSMWLGNGVTTVKTATSGAFNIT